MGVMIAQTSIQNGVQTDGFAIVEDVLSRQKVGDLLHALERIGDTGSVRNSGGIFAIRNRGLLCSMGRALRASHGIAASSTWTSPPSPPGRSPVAH